MANNIEGGQINSPIFDFRNKIGDLARPNLFQVELTFPQAGLEGAGIGGSGGAGDAAEAAAGETNTDATLATLLVKAANIPASTVGVIEVPYRGRTIKIAGDRTFEPWTVTVLNDANFVIRSQLENWSTQIQALQQNFQAFDAPQNYQTNAIVRQYDRQSEQTRAYKFEGIWPSNISAIDLAWDSNDTPEEYTVEFQVQYWTYASDVNAAHHQQQ
ncbi:tail tube monomer [Cyanophage P-TIM40]|uniref:Tail tube monomer n=1 Tax=Cyanophage P-TIM40 TaxID=1589733 RepID=A0A0C5AIT1_9CAUD|nr:tail protein [Cyanophage P-TIM40]AJK27558.1 tail tube monomer [Cyanophage P-TIM40]|tara:strand:- start:705 stop:1349 length:645 start_codon:yes stop_codon:yes gene_type:complete